MTTGEITRLTREYIAEIIRQLPHHEPQPHDGPEQREHPRLPSPGTVELRPLFSRQGSAKTGIVRNLCEGGLGMSSTHYFEPGSVQEIVVHLPHATFWTKASVCYCKKIRDEFMTGLTFMFEPS